MAICKMCGKEVSERFCPICGTEVQPPQQNQWQEPQQQMPQQNQWQQPQTPPQQNQWQPQQQNGWQPMQNNMQARFPGTATAAIVLFVISTIIAFAVTLIFVPIVKEMCREEMYGADISLGMGPAVGFAAAYIISAVLAIVGAAKRKFGISALLMLLQTLTAIVACVIVCTEVSRLSAYGDITTLDGDELIMALSVFGNSPDTAVGSLGCFVGGIFGSIFWLISFILMLVASGSVKKSNIY